MPNETTLSAADPAAVQAAQATAQAETTATEVQPVPEGADAAAAKPSMLQNLGPLPMILILLALFYFMMIRPQQRKDKERRKMIEELRAGAKVVFAGGLVGTIVEANEKTFIVETAPGTKMEILRSSVNGLVESGAAAK